MLRLKSVSAFTLLASLAIATPAFAESSTDVKSAASGIYQLDQSHASVTFRINHLGFSRYTGRFDKMEATLNFDKNAVEKSELDVTIYPNSVDTNNAKLEEELRNDKWFDVIKYPRATFHATKIELTGPTTGKVTGDFTLMGETRPLTLDVTLIGHGEHPMMKKATIGFSATGTLKRSAFGLKNGLPFVGDDVELLIEAEFNKAE